jgi:hypothetical protein
MEHNRLREKEEVDIFCMHTEPGTVWVGVHTPSSPWSLGEATTPSLYRWGDQALRDFAMVSQPKLSLPDLHAAI